MSDFSFLAPMLTEGLEQLGIQTAAAPLLDYLSLLNKWNRSYSLTAIRDPRLMITGHLLDSLAISPWLQGQRLLDVGTGAGLPGIPLALVHPELSIVLVESNGKKICFLQEVKRKLAINNLEIIQTRVENYHPTCCFDTLISRAFSDLAQLLKWTNHLIAIKGIWLAMKGRYPEAELAGINLPYQVKSYTVPGLDSERCCIIIENATKE